MNKKFVLISLIIAGFIVGGVGLMRAYANPFWSLVPPPTPTQGPKSLGQNIPLLPSVPLPTQVAKSAAEQTAVAQLQRSSPPGSEQSFAIPTRIGQAPDEKVRDYVDANFGFSFSYPANWQVDMPLNKTYSAIPEQGYLVTIRNFNDVAVKRDLDRQEIKIDLWLFSRPENYSTLEAWVTAQNLFAPGTAYSQLEGLLLGNGQAITWTATGSTVPQGARLYALEQKDRIYLAVSYPSTSSYTSTVNNIVESLK